MKRTILLLTFVVTVSCMHAQRMLTLEECRNLAIQNNKELQISGEKIKMADNEKKAAFTKYFPQLSANGAYMWNQKDINLLDNFIHLYAVTFTLILFLQFITHLKNIKLQIQRLLISRP